MADKPTTPTDEPIIGFDEFLALLPSTSDLPPSIERLVYDAATGKRELSDTPGLVDQNGVLQVTRTTSPDGSVTETPYYYDLNRDPQAAYYAMSPERRQLILDVLDARGVPTGSLQQNVKAFELLYSEANRFGKTADVMLADIIEKVPENKSQVRVAPKRVTSSSDLRQIIKGVARSTLGRDVSDELAAQWVQTFQQQQLQAQQRAAMQSGGVIEEMPSAEVSAQSFVQQYEPTQANAYKFLGYFDQLANSLGSRI
jgi:hypothetical protein